MQSSNKMNLAIGSLVLMGFLFVLFAVIFNLKGVNLLYPYVKQAVSYFIAANTCFLIAFIISTFDKPQK